MPVKKKRLPNCPKCGLDRQGCRCLADIEDYEVVHELAGGIKIIVFPQYFGDPTPTYEIAVRIAPRTRVGDLTAAARKIVDWRDHMTAVLNGEDVLGSEARFVSQLKKSHDEGLKYDEIAYRLNLIVFCYIRLGCPAAALELLTTIRPEEAGKLLEQAVFEVEEALEEAKKKAPVETLTPDFLRCFPFSGEEVRQRLRFYQ